MAELLLHIALVDLGPEGEVGAWRMGGADGLLADFWRDVDQWRPR